MPLHDLSRATQPSEELAYAQFTANVTVSGTTAATATTVVTAGAIVLDGVSTVLIECFVPVMDITASATSAVAVLYEGSTNLGRIGESFPNAQSAMSVFGAYRYTPSSGSRTYSLRAWKTGAGTVTAQAGSGGPNDADLLPGYIRIVKV